MFLFICWKRGAMLNRIFAISKKEVKQLIRDKRMMFVLFFFPVFLLIIFGYAVNFDVQNVRLAVQDNDHTATSRNLIKTLTSSSYFNIVEYVNNEKRGKELLNKGIAKGLLIIPTNFEKDIIRGKENTNVQILLDGVDGNSAAIIQNYSIAGINYFNKELRKAIETRVGRKIEYPINVESRFWYNPELVTTVYLLPGLIALILIVTTVMTVSLSIVREKERGTIEQINVSSLTIIELLIGKILPYLIISFINAGLILVAGFVLFGIVVKGSFFLLFITILFFLFTSTSIGIFISVISDSQQVAFSLATYVSLLPATILSGFIFPIESMPRIIQISTNITPAKYFIVALRAIMIKGVGISGFVMQWLYLLIFALVFLLLSVVKYQKIMKEK